MGTVEVSKIRQQLCMVITFPSPIFVNLKDKLWLAIIKENLSDKELPTNLESDTSSSTAPTSYRREELETMLGFMDEDELACTAWPRIQKKVTKVKNTQSLYLKCSLAVAFQPFGPLFFGRHDFKLIKASVITPRAELE